MKDVSLFDWLLLVLIFVITFASVWAFLDTLHREGWL